MAYPKVTNNITLEEQSINFFKKNKPQNWFCDKPGRDYGIDLEVSITEANECRGLAFVVQLKSSQNSSNNSGNTETVNLKCSTFNYLRQQLHVALIVKYIASEDEAYWVLLKDINPPREGTNSFTVHIPRTNTLSNMDWDRFTSYVRRISERKLSANRNDIAY